MLFPTIIFFKIVVFVFKYLHKCPDIQTLTNMHPHIFIYTFTCSNRYMYIISVFIHNRSVYKLSLIHI